MAIPEGLYCDVGKNECEHLSHLMKTVMTNSIFKRTGTCDKYKRQVKILNARIEKCSACLKSNKEKT